MIAAVNGIHIHYECEGSGRPLVMCHGYGGCSRDFDQMMDKLLPDYTVIRPDSRNAGGSDKVAAVHYSDMADDMACLIQSLKLNKPVFFGFSDGGITGLILASRYPELLSAMTVCSANLDPSGLRIWDRIKISMLYRKNPDAGIKAILTEPHIAKEELAKVKIPVLVLAGTKDLIRTSHSRKIASWLPDSELGILKGETHASYVMDKDTACEKALDFFARH